jgi:adenylate cyclase
MKRRLSTILAADVVGFSRLMETDEEATIQALDGCRKAIDKLIKGHDGRVFGSAGDSVIAEFSSPVEAVRCAVRIQHEIDSLGSGKVDSRRMRFRVGINLGDVVVDGENLLGDGVNVAARLESIAEPGGITLSRSVYDQVCKAVDLYYEDLGEQKVKNIEKPIYTYSILPRDSDQHVKSEIATPKASDIPSVAVLPFDNMSGDPEQEYFSDGITEDIITDLSKVSSLFVVARNSSFTYKGRSVKIQEISVDLGVDYVVEGSVRKSGNKIRISAQLVNGQSGGHIWADRYDGTLKDIFKLQDQVTCQIVDALKIQLLPEERSAINSVPTSNMEAYELYLKGRQSFHIFTEEKLYDALDYYSRAIDFDPDYAQVYCGVADAHSFLRFNHGKNYLSLVRAIAAASKAIELSQNLAEGHASLGLALTVAGEYDGAIEEYKKAVVLDRNLYEAHYYWGRACFSLGRLEETVEHFESAWRLSPSDPQTPSMLLQVYRSLDRTEDQLRVAKETVKTGLKKLELEPENWRACLSTAFGFMSLGNYEEMSHCLDQALAHNPDDAIVNYNVACLYCGLGDAENAVARLRKSFESGVVTEMISWMKNDSDLDPIRNNPEFKKLLDEQIQNL